MSLTVRPVEGRQEFETFVRFPWKIYKGDPHWVPPLLSDIRLLHDTRGNPFFEHARVQNFLAWEDGQPVGRISAIRNDAHNEFWKDRIGFFGFFECIRSPEVAEALLGEAARWLRSQGLTAMRGPANFSSNDDWGLLVDGFDSPPVLMMPYNPDWYEELLTGCGMEKAKDLVAYYLKAAAPPERLAVVDRIMAHKGYTVRPMDMKRFDEEVERVMHVYNSAWERNWGFVPMTRHELDHMAKQLRPMVDPDLVFFVEKHGETVAFALCMPDFYQALKHCNGRLFPFGLFQFLWHKRNIRQLRVLTLGIVPGYRNQGIDAALILALYRAATLKGYQGGELSWLLEDNTAIIRPIENLGGYRYKTYRVYEAPVERLT